MQSTAPAKRPLQGTASWRPPDTQTRSRPRVLLVDDEDTREMYAWCLRAAGWIVETATDGDDALLVASTFEPNVIVTDVRLPTLDGIEATRQLKASDLTKEIPVVACSGFDGPWADSLARRAGCEEFVAKPCSPEQLRALLERLVERPTTPAP